MRAVIFRVGDGAVLSVIEASNPDDLLLQPLAGDEALAVIDPATDDGGLIRDDIWRVDGEGLSAAPGETPPPAYRLQA